MPKLTKRLIESTSPQDKDLILWDSEISGFCCKITPAGKKGYFSITEQRIADNVNQK